MAAAEAYTLNITIEGYDGTAELLVEGDNFSKSFNVTDGVSVNIPEGNYTLMLYALNKTFVKDVAVANNTSVTFNLKFTSDLKNITVMRHAIIQPDLSVFEIVLVTNSGDANFEGDLILPLPRQKGFEVSESTLSFIDYSVANSTALFKSLIVPANDSGRITLVYTLQNPEFSIRSEVNQSLLVLTTGRVEEYRGLVFEGVQNLGGIDYMVYRGTTLDCYLRISSEPEVNLDPASMLGIALISAATFLYFYSKRGGWV